MTPPAIRPRPSSVMGSTTTVVARRTTTRWESTRTATVSAAPATNCPQDANPRQADVDADGTGNVCDNCAYLENANQSDIDGDSVGDVCDSCPESYDPTDGDLDGDRVGDSCDNCPDVPNLTQSDSDDDGEGDLLRPRRRRDLRQCLRSRNARVAGRMGPRHLEFLQGRTSTCWLLRETTSRNPVPNAAARHELGLIVNWVLDPDLPAHGERVFFLVTGTTDSTEGSLGQASGGTERADLP